MVGCLGISFEKDVCTVGRLRRVIRDEFRIVLSWNQNAPLGRGLCFHSGPVEQLFDNNSKIARHRVDVGLFCIEKPIVGWAIP